MQIKTIQLENIRSHVKTLINFSEGFNCLVGGVGAGKSTILYAIDFALFGDPLARSYEYLLREGSEVGRITLDFIEKGKEYTIVRGLKRRGGGISQDAENLKFFEGDRLIAEMKSDAVAEQVKSVTGLDRNIFREIVWVQQEHLKDILDLPPSERQKRLDQLFGLSDYEASYANLRPVLRWYESENASLEREPDIVGIKELQSKYDDSVRELAVKEAELEETKRQLSEAEARFKEASDHLAELEVVRRENEALGKEEAKLQANVQNIERSLARLAVETEGKKKRIKELENRLRTLKNQENAYRKSLQDIGLPQDITLEQLQEQADILIDQVSGIKGEKENRNSETKRAAQRVTDLAKESRCPLCLQALSSEYKDGLMKRLYQETSENKLKMNELEENARHLEQLRGTVSSAISNLRTIRTKSEDATEQMAVEHETLNDALQEADRRLEEEKDLATQLSALHLKVTEFDLAKLDEAQSMYKSAFELFSTLRSKIQSAESQKRETLSRLESLKERLDAAQKKTERLERVKHGMDLTEEIRQAYRSIQPKLRSEFVAYLQKVVQQVLDELAGAEGSALAVKVDGNYTPITESEDGHERNVSNLSGGERTHLAFAYRLGIGQLIMNWRVGHGLRMLLLDEPTESLGSEDGSIDRLAESISRLKSVEQIIAVTHSEAFAEKADHVIRLEKRTNQSVVSAES
jgi:exonuclease SbcC